jgi:hypothetical protein
VKINGVAIMTQINPTTQHITNGIFDKSKAICHKMMKGNQWGVLGQNVRERVSTPAISIFINTKVGEVSLAGLLLCQWCRIE